MMPTDRDELEQGIAMLARAIRRRVKVLTDPRTHPDLDSLTRDCYMLRDALTSLENPPPPSWR